MGDARTVFLLEKIGETFGVSPDELRTDMDGLGSEVRPFFEPDGPAKLIFVYQAPDAVDPKTGAVTRVGAKRLALTDGDGESVDGRAAYFIRNNPKGITEKFDPKDISVGSIKGGVLSSFNAVLSQMFHPALRVQHPTGWGKLKSKSETSDFVGNVRRFGAVLKEAAASVDATVELAKPDQKYIDQIPLKPLAFKEAADTVETVNHMDSVLLTWVANAEACVEETGADENDENDAGAANDAPRDASGVPMMKGASDDDDMGPDTELEYWRRRMGLLNSIIDQTKTDECRLVLGVCMAARSHAHKAWKQIDLRLTDASNEAKDNVKYLTTLEKSLEPMYASGPKEVLEGVPALLSNVKMMYTIARYYHTPERMTRLFAKISNQMLTCCKTHLVDAGPDPWTHDKAELLGNLRLIIALYDKYYAEYQATKQKLATQVPKPRQFDFNEDKIFSRFGLFKRRCEKLADMFDTIIQFEELGEHKEIVGMEALITRFFRIVNEFKRKPYNLLDFQQNQFDRDYMEFIVGVNELEFSLQDLINKAFEKISSTESALTLLGQFTAVMRRDALKDDLDSKYVKIFRNYAQDLESVQKLYEKQKHAPPLPRNAPPVAGDILWARQLLRRIEGPMRYFAGMEGIMAMKEAKPVVKLYNRVATALMTYETLWHQAWVKGVEESKNGLRATLLVRHPKTGELLVNFDREIGQLIRESKFMMRMDVEVPDAARIVLAQEDKFKSYYNQLAHTINMYTALDDEIAPVTRPLLKAHLAELEMVIAPGMTDLTWTSTNIDMYLKRVHRTIDNLELVVSKVNDMLHHRVDDNLKDAARIIMVDLPKDELVTLEEFSALQTKYVKEKAEILAIKSEEVRRGCDDLVELIQSHMPNAEPGDLVTAPTIEESAIAEFKAHFARLMYSAVLHATRKSFDVLKNRIASKASGGFLFIERPLFDVDVELSVPYVQMSPSLDDVQRAVNGVAKKMLNASRTITRWGNTDLNGDEENQPGVDYDNLGTGSFFDEIASDIDVVKLCLLLTGAMHGCRTSVETYLTAFTEYDFLYLQDLQVAYEAFMAKKPNIDMFETELQKYMDIEQHIGKIAPVHNIGALSLETQPLKVSLKAEAATWKKQFAKNLHAHGKDQLDTIVQYMKDTTLQLNRKIEDLEDVRHVMAIQQDIRVKESEIDSIMNPIEEVYGLLARYEVKVPKEETDVVAELRDNWTSMNALAVSVGENLQRLQAGFKRDLVAQVKVFVVDAGEFRRDWDANGPMVDGLAPADAVERLENFQTKFAPRKAKWDNFSSGEALFGLPVTLYPELEKTEKEIEFLDKLYSLWTNVTRTIGGYVDILWHDVKEQIDVMTETATSFQAQCKKLPKAMRDWPAYVDLRKKIDDFLEMLPLIQMLAAPAMRPRHWTRFQEITGSELDMAEDTFKLRNVVECSILKHFEDIEECAAGAVKEEQVEIKLKQVDGDWEDLIFVFNEFKQHGRVVLDMVATAELIEKLEDTSMALGGMATNRYSAPFKGKVSDWITKMSTIEEIINMWLNVQNMWMYMEAVFSGGDIVKQLPSEAKRFKNIDKQFVKMAKVAADIQNVVEVCCDSKMMMEVLPVLTEQLELCQKALTAFLDTKRAMFPRFYFVSDPTLLEILSLGSDPPSVCPHFQSGLFDSVTAIEFDKEDKYKMLKMFSQQNEEVAFQTFIAGEGGHGHLEEKPVIATGNIESWLQALVDGMQDSIKSIIRKAHDEVQTQELEEFIFGHPAQISLLGIQFMWTNDMQSALTVAKQSKDAMREAYKKQADMLKEMIVITTRTTIGKNDRKNLETCITVHVHQRDTSEELMKKRIKDPADFEWMKQARFYWNKGRETVIISICDVDFEYSYEYLGVKERLVITPLTDICYVTLSQALGMFLGGAPAGPAGTGKTETTKDLGNTLGKYVVVFNCSDQMDYKGMGKIYRGLAQSGLWGCFDEFNRINLDVLSVCAQQVYCVLQAIRERKTEFIFTDGARVSLDVRVGFFITMNPGYAGRQELPENLKALFRGVTMMVPNRQIIKKVKLAACGYMQNEFLAKKFFVLYGLCEQQLSKQAHYDFGLRNILSVLRTMGASKRANPEKSEPFLAMRTLRDMNMSKFVAEDVPLFLSLIADIFPGIKADKAVFPDVEAAMAKVATEKGLQLHPSWLAKCVQLYETYLVRHGIMLVGPTGGGKTAIIETLAGALTELGTKHVIWKMNPKAITAPQMFGRLDATTGDWTDGVFAVLWRRAAKEKKNNTWIVLDGPVDAIWIENLNTVLDDNKVLTLANGDRVQMSGIMKAMFEPENLNNASPATVSRAGIIFVSETELGWKPMVDSWLDTRAKHESAALKPLFEKYVDALLDVIRIECKPVMAGSPWAHVSRDFCQVSTLVTLLKGILKPSEESGEHLSSGHYERMFLYCCTWALGGLLDMKDRPPLNKAMVRLAESEAPNFEDPEETFFEYFVSEEDTEWRHWNTQVPAWEYPVAEEKPKFARLIIPTLDSVRLESLLKIVTSVDKQALFVGGPGTAKTTAIKQFMAGFDSDTTATKDITFSSLTQPGTFQVAIESSVEKRSGRTFGPPSGKKMIVFVDDISMPVMNDWGDQVTNEVVRQLLEEGGMYSLEKPIGDMKMIVDCVYLAAMNTPGGGKNDIPNRLKRHFCIFNVPLPSVAAINNIFGQLVAGRFASDVFSANVVAAAEKLVPITVDLWNRVQAKMLPTPAKFHYLFNMRELSKVFQGLILAERDRFRENERFVQPFGGKVKSPEAYLVALWRHECERVFCDKLTTQEDKDWGDSLIMRLIDETYGEEITAQVTDRVYFVDFLRPPKVDEETGETVDANPSYYESTESLNSLREVAMARQADFNETSKSLKLDLVLFEDALNHMMRISRLLCMERGSALLIGVGGSGKQSLTRLAAYIAGAFPFQIQITKTYNQANLFEDLKALYKVAGLKGQKVAFIFTDAEVKEESFLEYINQILMTGEVAGLFPKDEQDMIVNDARGPYKKECPGELDSYDNLWSFFMSRVRDNLHLCLCFSPVGDKFSRRARDFPGLINGCTIDWFLPWPQDALIAVSTKFIGDFDMACDDDDKTKLQEHMGHVHVAVTTACKEYFEKFRRNVYVTPKSYLSYLAGYCQLYESKLSEVNVLANKINSGLSKLFTAKEDVGTMKIELQQKNVDLEEAQKMSEKLLKEISASTAVAEKEKARVAVIVEGVVAKANEIDAKKIEAEEDLKLAQPAMDEALEALNSIDQKSISQLKTMKNPPDLVKRIFDTVLLLRQLPMAKIVWKMKDKVGMVIDGSENYKEEAMKMMADTGFLNKLLNFPKERINDETCELLEPYFDAPDFNFEDAKKSAGAVAGLCNWCRSMVKYHWVAAVVDPKMRALREAQATLDEANREKAMAEGELAEVQAGLDAMQAKFDEAMAEKQRLIDDAAATQARMDAATALITALAGEEVRWTEQSKQFAAQIQRLTGDCALASSFTSYLGPFNKEFRDLLLTRDFFGDLNKREIPVTADLDVARFLVDDSEIGEWTLQGLPTDELSIQNGIMTTRASRYPVLVDPQGQGINWIKNREAENNLKVTNLNEKRFRDILEESMSYGLPMLIENIQEELDPILEPVLEKRIVRKGKQAMIVLSDGKEVDYDDNFTLICTTRLPNPHYSPELSAKVTVIDFTVTMVGLEDQLLGKLILKEKNELEVQRKTLVEEVTSYKKKIKQLEDDLLFRLSNSQGNLLDDVELIEVLNVTKKTAQEVNEKLANASETNAKITETCEEYRPVAHRATLIYFLIAEFASVNVMYQTSLKQFNELYELAIDEAEPSGKPATRIKNIIDHMTYSVYLYIQRGLFERHKLTFALMMTNTILVSDKILNPELVSVFLKGGGSLDIKSVKKKPKEWIPDKSWLDCVALSSYPTFATLQDSMRDNNKKWQDWYDKEAPENVRIPDFEDVVTPFERMCLVKALREDRTQVAAQAYIADAIGQRFVESVPLNIEATWDESTPYVPIICLLSPGSDPTKLIEELAKRQKIKVNGVSMGQGQEIIARKLMTSATREGHWVLLQNTHLGLNYMGEIETYMTKAAEEPNIHHDFRLWITAEPHPQFPIGLLQMSIKLTNEAPVGMRAGLRNSYNWVSQDMIDAVPLYEWRQLLYVMCYLHSVVQERRKFGPIGWNIQYEFNASDLSACVQFLQNHTSEMDVKKLKSPTWATVTYMISSIQYGGRITDGFDELLMDTYAAKYFNKGNMEKGIELFPGYPVPDTRDIDVFRADIEKLPPVDSPEVFGLHPNADLTFRTLQVRELVETVVSTMPKSGGGGGGKSPAEVVDAIAEDLLSKVPKMFETERAKIALNKLPGGPTQPLTVHLRQEIDRLNIIVDLTTKTLKNLRLAIAGTVALSGDLVDALDALFDAKIPAKWLKWSWESGALGTWFQGLLQRHKQLETWLTKGRPKAYWLTGFFNPQGFLTAMKQEVNRQHAKDKWALDDVVMTSEVTHPPQSLEKLKAAPNEGVYVYGLFLEGCTWDGKKNMLTDSEPKKLYTPLPVLYVTGVLSSDYSKKETYEAPTYRVKKRTGLNFISTFPLRTEDHPSKWVMRGVALLCSVD